MKLLFVLITFQIVMLGCAEKSDKSDKNQNRLNSIEARVLRKSKDGNYLRLEKSTELEANDILYFVDVNKQSLEEINLNRFEYQDYTLKIHSECIASDKYFIQDYEIKGNQVFVNDIVPVRTYLEKIEKVLCTINVDLLYANYKNSYVLKDRLIKLSLSSDSILNEAVFTYENSIYQENFDKIKIDLLGSTIRVHLSCEYFQVTKNVQFKTEITLADLALSENIESKVYAMDIRRLITEHDCIVSLVNEYGYLKRSTVVRLSYMGTEPKIEFIKHGDLYGNKWFRAYSVKVKNPHSVPTALVLDQEKMHFAMGHTISYLYLQIPRGVLFSEYPETRSGNIIGPGKGASFIFLKPFEEITVVAMSIRKDTSIQASFNIGTPFYALKNPISGFEDLKKLDRSSIGRKLPHSFSVP